MPRVTWPYFNLLDEPWIPVIMGGGERKRLGLLEIFRQAAAVRAVEHPSPLAAAALHRLLLAVLYRALNPKLDDVAEWFESGWPMEAIAAYLEKWRERFFLFHETHPFWQVAEFEAEGKKSWSVLAAEHNAYNAKVLFDHFDVSSGLRVAPADAACWLAAAQIFAVSSGKSEIAHTSTAPSATALMAFSMGGNLRKTLLFNFPYQKADIAVNDFPVWEKMPDTVDDLKSKPSRVPTGFANLYTWSSRTVRLYCEDDGTVSQIGFASGMGCENTSVFHDPHIAYVFHEKNGLLPLKPNQRGLWRDFDSLLPCPKAADAGKSCAPLVIDHTAALCRKLERRPGELSVMVCGQVNDNAKIEFWRMERFVLPAAILDESIDARATVKSLLDRAQTWQSKLYRACAQFAKECIRRNGGREPASSDIRGVVEQMPCMAVYWSHLEHAFKRDLEKYPYSKQEQALVMWLSEIRKAIDLAWQAQREAVGEGDAWTIRAMSKAGLIIGKALKDLNEQIDEQKNIAGQEGECLNEQ